MQIKIVLETSSHFQADDQVTDLHHQHKVPLADHPAEPCSLGFTTQAFLSVLHALLACVFRGSVILHCTTWGGEK